MLGSLMCIYMHSYLPQIHGHVVLYVAITCACIDLCRKHASLGICVRETRIPTDMCAGKHASLETHITGTPVLCSPGFRSVN